MHGAGQSRHCPVGPLGFQGAHGLGDFFQAEGADRVVEQG
jgi:hypothetical protein